ncbi:hypothetical protein [Asticcacaulis endophyticus]|nr:hypothetical protein [Asticcacaulis endophyticus]
MFEDAEEVIGRYVGTPEREIRRYRSWSLFYYFFNGPDQDRSHYSPHLAAYLASWGMYRGSSELLRAHDYTVHDGAIDIIRQYPMLNEADLSTYTNIGTGALFQLIEALRKHYKDRGVTPTDTLISKILLSCLACVPAYDTFFKAGVLDRCGIAGDFLKRECFEDFLVALEGFQTPQRNCHQGQEYPFFKLVDMYFFQAGKPIVEEKKRRDSQMRKAK